VDRFPGLYAGSVVDNDDPKGLCRLKAKVPEVLGDESVGWCLPSLPYSGSAVGLAVVPPVGATVWVTWPAGDVTRVPVWTGAAWSDGDGVPGAGPDRIVLLTPAGNKVEIVDAPGDEAVTVEAASGAKVVLDADGVLLGFGAQKVALTSSSVSVNDGALEVR